MQGAQWNTSGRNLSPARAHYIYRRCTADSGELGAIYQTSSVRKVLPGIELANTSGYPEIKGCLERLTKLDSLELYSFELKDTSGYPEESVQGKSSSSVFPGVPEGTVLSKVPIRSEGLPGSQPKIQTRKALPRSYSVFNSRLTYLKSSQKVWSAALPLKALLGQIKSSSNLVFRSDQWQKLPSTPSS